MKINGFSTYVVNLCMFKYWQTYELIIVGIMGQSTMSQEKTMHTLVVPLPLCTQSRQSVQRACPNIFIKLPATVRPIEFLVVLYFKIKIYVFTSRCRFA